MLVFFDTEFTELGANAKLISIGFVTEDGSHTFYAELTDTFEASDCSDYATHEVLPFLEGGLKQMTFMQLAQSLGLWLASVGGSVQLATDSYSRDWYWIERIFLELGLWPINVDTRPVLLTAEHMDDYDRFLQVVNRSLMGLRRHHALDDARANRQGWLAAI